MKSAGLQSALYDTLTGNVGLMALINGVFIPQAPQASDSGSDDPFPYVALPMISQTPNSTFGKLGYNARVQVDMYARTASDLQIRAIEDAIDSALNRVPLVIPGATWIDTMFESSSQRWEDQGRTRGIMMFYRVTYFEV